MPTNNLPQPQITNTATNQNKAPEIDAIGFDIHAEMEQLENLMYDSPRIPFVNKILLDEDKVIRQLDLIRMNIPEILEEAIRIVAQKNQIIAESQAYAQKIVENAQRKAAQLLDDSRIVQQAESQASDIRKRVQQDCEALQRKTINDVEQMRHKIQQEAFKTRQQAILEAEEIQTEADQYTDAMLLRLEQQLTEMLRIVNNGRQEINRNHNLHQTKHQEALVSKKVS